MSNWTERQATRMYRALGRYLDAHGWKVLVINGPHRVSKRGGKGMAERYTLEVDFTGGQKQAAKQ